MHEHKVTSIQSTKKVKFKSTFEQLHDYHEMLQRYQQYICSIYKVSKLKVTSIQSTKKAKFKSTFEQLHNYHKMIQ